MLGAIIGDISGSRFEFNNHRSKDFELFTRGCCITDDSIMTLAVAKSIMESGKETRAGAAKSAPEYYNAIEKKLLNICRISGESILIAFMEECF